MPSENTQEIWHVEANDTVYETNFAEMTSWIDNGSLLRQDKVRKGNLRWIEAGKVPALIAVFNAKENGQPLPPVVTLTKMAPTAMPGTHSVNQSNTVPTVSGSTSESSIVGEPVCSVHADTPAVFVCETCANNFCRTCPNSYGGNVKICPFCGAMCASIAKVAEARTAETILYGGSEGPFGFGDFGAALAYPFKFKTSLILGAFMYALVSVGQGAMGFGGIYMLGGALACFLVANTLTFGILANTVNNFSQGKIGGDFMPSFDDFSIWDDVVHPFFLSIGVYLVSFGPMILLGLAAFFLVVNPTVKEMNSLKTDVARSVSPEMSSAANSVRQSQDLKNLINKTNDEQKGRIAAMEDAAGQDDRAIQPDVSRRPGGNVVDPEDEDFRRTQELIQKHRKAELETMIGKTPETKANEQAAIIKKIVGYGAMFLILGGLCLLWGFLYFPAACAVAGYTRSFSATLNPSVGFDTIKHLGVDYVKILLMCLLIGVISSAVGMVLAIVFMPFDMPSVGNLPAKFVGNLIGFYLSVVFSCVLGFALYKAADRLQLAR